MKTAATQPGRLLVFANLDFSGIDDPLWGARTAAQLEADVKAGAQGLKIFKNFGMTLKDGKGARVRVDDPRLGKLLDELPNVFTEIGAVLAELGRQPRFARAFFVQYQDRVLFGKDIWEPSEYWVYFRVLETPDEYFDYYRKRHAFWKMYGLELPDGVLKKLYYKNALRLLPSIDASAFPD